MFSQFKKDVQNNINALVASHNQIYVTGVEKDKLWDTYLNAFPEEERQGHNCNSCRQFIKNYGAMVFIDPDYTLRSIWDVKTLPEFEPVVDALNALVLSEHISDIFVTEFTKLGTDRNSQLTPGEIITWEHLYCELPKQFVTKLTTSHDTLRGEARTTKQVFKRALDEITIDAVNTVLELISQNSLYRGEESLPVLREFLSQKQRYYAVPFKDNYVWHNFKNSAAARIRNTAIGTLLVAISEGTDLDIAVAAFERIMAPANYKRPTAIITTRMIADAEKTIAELGLTASLGRRYAVPEDITVNNVLYVNRDTKKAIGLFNELKDSVAVSPKSFSRVEEIDVHDFIRNVIPIATSVELLVENKHYPNFVSIIAPKDAEAPSLFKWNNGFSWSYQDNMADSLKEKVKSAGGKVDGYLRVSLEWWNYDDLDLHIHEPGGEHVYFAHRRSLHTGGTLDVDMNAGGRSSRTPVENIVYPIERQMREGNYKIVVNNFSRRETKDVGYNVEIEFEGQILSFTSAASPGEKNNDIVATFSYSKKDGVRLLNAPGTEKVTSRNIWGIDTNKLHKVSMIMNSPNHWNAQAVGNEHLFFILEGAKNPGEPRGFFNEFIPESLMKHKRVFEALGNKLKVEPSDRQLNGLGFSSTLKQDVIVKVEGAFSRILKIKF